MDTIGRIRREHFLKGKTIKEIVRDRRVSRNTVRKVLRSGAASFEYDRGVQPWPKLGRWTAELDKLLDGNAAKSVREQLLRRSARYDRPTRFRPRLSIIQRLSCGQRAAFRERHPVRPIDPPATDPLVLIICGGRRTGTTLLAAILSSDGRTNPLGQEAKILTQIVSAYRWGRKNFENFGQSFFGDLEAYRSFFRETVARLACDVSARISPGGVLILKNPELATKLVDVVDLFPDAVFLVTVRDPRDQIASELEVAERRQAAGLPDHHFGTRNVVALSQRYVNYFHEIFAVRRQQPGRINIVRYEDLVLRTGEALTSLRAVTGLDLPFDPTKPWTRVSPLAALQGEGGDRSDLYGAPIDTASVGRFKHDLTAEEAAAVEEASAELMKEFGYDQLG